MLNSLINITLLFLSVIGGRKIRIIYNTEIFCSEEPILIIKVYEEGKIIDRKIIAYFFTPKPITKECFQLKSINGEYYAKYKFNYKEWQSIKLFLSFKVSLDGSREIDNTYSHKKIVVLSKYNKVEDKIFGFPMSINKYTALKCILKYILCRTKAGFSKLRFPNQGRGKPII